MPAQYTSWESFFAAYPGATELELGRHAAAFDNPAILRTYLEALGDDGELLVRQVRGRYYDTVEELALDRDSEAFLRWSHEKFGPARDMTKFCVDVFLAGKERILSWITSDENLRRHLLRGIGPVDFRAVAVMFFDWPAEHAQEKVVRLLNLLRPVIAEIPGFPREDDWSFVGDLDREKRPFAVPLYPFVAERYPWLARTFAVDWGLGPNLHRKRILGYLCLRASQWRYETIPMDFLCCLTAPSMTAQDSRAIIVEYAAEIVHRFKDVRFWKHALDHGCFFGADRDIIRGLLSFRGDFDPAYEDIEYARRASESVRRNTYRSIRMLLASGRAPIPSHLAAAISLAEGDTSIAPGAPLQGARGFIRLLLHFEDVKEVRAWRRWGETGVLGGLPAELVEVIALEHWEDCCV
ncbi:hypothetical protein DFJ74DRAFT_738844 [Hyaloraphidium curvatum]|nr:hypothetical protein DFJ74DRAFT_738844 [Hyaloraphidium curvatum]